MEEKKQEEIFYQAYDISNDGEGQEKGNFISVSRILKHLFSDDIRSEDASVTFAGLDVIEPIYSPEDLAILADKVGRLKTCISLMADNTVGLGWKFSIKRRFLLADSAVKQRINRQIELLEDFIDNVNDELDFIDLMRLVKIDEETTGNGYLEVIRNLRGEPARLNHLPSHTVRLTKSGLYVQVRNGKKRYFKPYGSDIEVDAETGKVDEITIPATEVLHFKIPNARSSFYGIPRWIPVLSEIYVNLLVHRRNIAFLENSSAPRLFVLVQNASLSEGSKEMLRRLFQKDLKGVENVGRTIVLEVQQGKAIGGTQPTSKIELQPLPIGIDAETMMLDLIKSNNGWIRESFRIAESFFSEEVSNRSTSLSARITTIDTVFAPEAKRYENLLNKTIIKDLGIDMLRLEFVLPPRVDDLDQSVIDNRYASSGALTMNDARMRLGLPPYPKEFSFANLPLSLVITAVNSGLISLEDILASLEGEGKSEGSGAEVVIKKLLSNVNGR